MAHGMDIVMAALFASVILMGAGWLIRGRLAYLTMAAGMALFGVFWAAQVPHFLNIGDAYNAGFCAAALPFYGFLAAQSYMSWRWDEEVNSLRWMAGMSALAAGVYYGMSQWDPLAEALVRLVASMSAGILDVLGYHVHAGPTRWTDLEGPMIPILPKGVEEISIVMSCTGIQAMAMFGAAICATRLDRAQWLGWARRDLAAMERARGKYGSSLTLRWNARARRRLLAMSDRERALRAFMYTVPVIFFANLARNAGVVWVVYTGRMDFYLAHHVVAKLLALFLMVFMAMVIFDLLPELYENVLGLYDLRRRLKRGMVHNGFVDAPSDGPSKGGNGARGAKRGPSAGAGQAGGSAEPPRGKPKKPL